ncbi:hypothetical protein ACTG4Q_32925 [Bradyrhizobium denitrificans]
MIGPGGAWLRCARRRQRRTNNGRQQPFHGALLGGFIRGFEWRDFRRDPIALGDQARQNLALDLVLGIAPVLNLALDIV